MKNKKILFLTWKDIKHPAKWWAEVVMYNYMKRLVERWYEVFWLWSGFKDWQKDEIIDGIKIFRRFSLYTIYFFAWSWYLDFIRKEKIDLVIDEAWWIPLMSPLFLFKMPIIFFIHHIWDKEWDAKLFFPFNKIFKFIFSIILNLYKSKTTITVSKSSKQELIDNFGFDNDKIKIIENALDINPIDEIDFQKKNNSILSLGRIAPIKRVEDSIKAFHYFINQDEKFQNYTLDIAWNCEDKKYLNELKSLIIELKLENKINIIWFIEDKEKFILKHKLWLVPSRKEGFWIVVLEWNCFWIPVLWYHVPWLRDSINEWINWFLIKDWDWQWLWKKMSEILWNIDFFEKISKSSLEYVKNLPSWEVKTDELELIINN